MVTTKRYKNDTPKVSKRNNNKGDQDLIDEPVCLLTETHSRLDGQELLKRVDGRVFVNLRHTCPPCEEKISCSYAQAVNAEKIDYCYEVYRDTCVRISFKNSILYDQLKPEQEGKIKKLQADLEHFYDEKTYIPNLKNGVDCYEFFKKQGVEIENTDDQITIRFPHDREFTLPDEIKAINIITKERNGLQTINFKDHTITIQKRDIGELD